MKRASGVLMHISSLSGKYSTGSFGDGAKDFIDYLSNAGFSWWQVLPFCPVDECNSPYKSNGAFGLNPYFVDLEILLKKGLIYEDELIAHEQKTPYLCEFERLKENRLSLLKKASKRVKNKEIIEKYIDKNPYIKEFCEFMALKDINGEKPWNMWDNENINEEVLFMWKFIQYEFFAQWTDIKNYANSKGIKIIGDIPIYVSYDSADVWAHKELFLLDEENKPTCIAGVPPDYFSAEGQMWGNPIYNWKKMKEDGFLWWMDRIRHMFSMFDGVRIDHFRGIESYWSIPNGAKTAKEGKWEKGPEIDFINELNKIKGDKLIIAEDLGIITKEVEELVKISGYPGMRVLQFGFLGEKNSLHMPHNYIKNSVSYTGTHDNNTLLGYVWELDDKNRRQLLEYCGYYEDNWNDCYDNILRTFFLSNSNLAIVPIQDLLLYGADTRFNVPGRKDGNWGFRVTKEQLENINWNKFKRWNELYAR